MELCSVLDGTEDGAIVEKHTQPDTAMDYREAQGETQHRIHECEEENEKARMMRQVSDQEMAAEEQDVTSQMMEEEEDEEGKGGHTTDMRH